MALLRMSKVFVDEYDAISANYDEAVLAVMNARNNIREYFSGNIIHKDISVERPVEGSWMRISILGDRMTIYVRSPEEVQLIEKFLGRRMSDITALTNEYDDKFKEMNNWFKPSMDAAGSKSELNIKLDLAEYDMHLASLKRSLEYIRFLQGLVDFRELNG